MQCTYKNCKNRLTQAQVHYSYRVYNKGLCWDHQRAYDLLKREELGDLKADLDKETRKEGGQDEQRITG